MFSIVISHLLGIIVGILTMNIGIYSNVVNQYLAIGDCKQEGDSYCTRLVPNSYCAMKKNNCYCKSGHVAVKRGADYICKTLLTNTKCRLDKDCTDVKGSICHPGAGFCSCPSNTVFVPQLNECKEKERWSANNKICKQCAIQKGVCYRNSQSDRSISSLVSNSSFHKEFGCLCSVKNAMPHKLTKDFSNICEALLMDIGDFCNDRHLLCRSKRARCIRQPESIARVCMCPSDTIPIYQYHLKYYECVPKQPSSDQNCSRCFVEGGQCYRNSPSSPRLLCNCGRLRRSLSGDLRLLSGNKKKNKNGNSALRLYSNTKSRQSMADVCSTNFLKVTCNSKSLRVCYIPHSNPPYNDLPRALKTKRAKVFLSSDFNNNNPDNMEQTGFNNGDTYQDGGSNNNNDNNVNMNIQDDKGSNQISGNYGADSICHLMQHRTALRSVEEYCTDVSLTSTVLPCGIVMVQYSSGNIYSGFLQVWVDSKFPTPSRDIKIEINCKVQPDTSKNQFGQALDRTDSLLGKSVNLPGSIGRSTLSLSGPLITLKILNENDHEITETNESSAIKIDILLVDRSGEFNGIEVESCYLSNVSYTKFDPTKHVENFIIDRGCSVTSFPLFQNLFSDSKVPSTPVHLQSSLFPAFRFSASDPNVYFRCLLRVCRHTAWCQKPSNCQGGSRNRESIIANDDDLKFVVRSVKLRVGSFPNSNEIMTPLKHGKNARNQGNYLQGSNRCQYPLCLTLGHLILIGASFSIILLLTILLAILLYRRHISTNCHQLLLQSSTVTNSYSNGGPGNSIMSFPHGTISMTMPNTPGVPIETDGLSSSLLAPNFATYRSYSTGDATSYNHLGNGAIMHDYQNHHSNSCYETGVIPDYQNYPSNNSSFNSPVGTKLFCGSLLRNSNQNKADEQPLNNIADLSGNTDLHGNSDKIAATPVVMSTNNNMIYFKPNTLNNYHNNTTNHGNYQQLPSTQYNTLPSNSGYYESWKVNPHTPTHFTTADGYFLENIYTNSNLFGRNTEPLVVLATSNEPVTASNTQTIHRQKNSNNDHKNTQQCSDSSLIANNQLPISITNVPLPTVTISSISTPSTSKSQSSKSLNKANQNPINDEQTNQNPVVSTTSQSKLDAKDDNKKQTNIKSISNEINDLNNNKTHKHISTIKDEGNNNPNMLLTNGMNGVV